MTGERMSSSILGRLPLNSPNDVALQLTGRSGSPTRATATSRASGREPVVGDFVYRHDPTTGVAVVADSLDKPNGLAFSPDERGAVRHRQRRQPAAGQLLRRSPAPHQGVRRDRWPAASPASGCSPSSTRVPGRTQSRQRGRVYASSFSGVQVLEPSGQPSARSGCRAPSTSASAGPSATCCSSPPTPRSGSPTWPRRHTWLRHQQKEPDTHDHTSNPSRPRRGRVAYRRRGRGAPRRRHPRGDRRRRALRRAVAPATHAGRADRQLRGSRSTRPAPQRSSCARAGSSRSRCRGAPRGARAPRRPRADRRHSAFEGRR